MIVRIKLSIDIFQGFEFATLYGIFISEYRSLKFCRFFFCANRFRWNFKSFSLISLSFFFFFTIFVTINQ